MEDLIRMENTPAGQRALALHYEIKTTLEQVATGMVNFCRQLKTMRDEKLYLHIGFDTFDDYVEKSHKIKRRQRYTYISTLEKLGARLMEQNADVGITKLQLLTQISAVHRDEFLEENDLANISVKELEKLIEEKNDISEQLAMFQNENDRKTEERETMLARIADLQKQLEERDQVLYVPEVETSSVDTDVAEKIRQEAHRQRQAEKEAEVEAVERRLKAQHKVELKEQQEEYEATFKKEKDKLSVDFEKEKQIAVEQARKEWERENNSNLKAEIEKANQRAIQLEKELAIKSDDSLVKFSILFENLQNTLVDCAEVLREIGVKDSTKSEKLKDAIRVVVDKLLEGEDGED